MFGKLSNSQRVILSEMQEAARDMAFYDDLYKSFRKIRHDFANYVQSSGYESEDDSFILRVRMLKKDTLSDVNNLLKRLDQLPYDIEKPEPVYYYPYLEKRKPEAGKRKAETRAVLSGLWEKMKEYYISQQNELPVMKNVLVNLQDRLERSLPPDEEESHIHLEECDSIRFHMTAEDPLLASYVYVFRNSCLEKDADFRFRIQVPSVFKDDNSDLYYLLALAYQTAMDYLEVFRGGLIRISFASGMGLWHFLLDMKPVEVSDEEDAADEKKFDAEILSEFHENMSRDKALIKMLKKLDATLKVKREQGRVSIDIVG